ncbi:hypothetical protein HBA55_30185 [Pseudomaricurvus alkylphenolicus]|uniref:hypothetical protein n=1 Tax=Pseudomaricurvus alkylphenolicus TaxID=1306991 RepID=UPI00141F2E15|nr:hypothetical protein [Pseudomaricurvus alkylphenolicus]NIB43910.1 hypothetical protein [Pseudomaricurvus alkylphenolicus]
METGRWIARLLSWGALLMTHTLVLLLILLAVFLDRLTVGILPQLLDLWVLF